MDRRRNHRQLNWSIMRILSSSSTGRRYWVIEMRLICCSVMSTRMVKFRVHRINKLFSTVWQTLKPIWASTGTIRCRRRRISSRWDSMALWMDKVRTGLASRCMRKDRPLPQCKDSRSRQATSKIKWSWAVTTRKAWWTQRHARQLKKRRRKNIISRMACRVGVTSNSQTAWTTSTKIISHTPSVNRQACNYKTLIRRCTRICPIPHSKRCKSNSTMPMAKSLSTSRAKYMGNPLLDNSIRPLTSPWQIIPTTLRKRRIRRHRARWIIRTRLLKGPTV